MADTDAGSKEVFRRSTMNRITSAEELDHYIKVTNPSAWVVIIAALLLVGGIIVWAIIAIVPITVNTTGVALEGPNNDETAVICWVDKVTADRIGDSGVKAIVDGVEAKNAVLDKVPMSASEVMEILGSDFYAESIDLQDWNYPVTIIPSGPLPQSDFVIGTQVGAAHLVQVSLIVTESHPINIVLGKK